MTKSHRWAEFQRFLREVFRADPHYSRIPNYFPSGWRPPSESASLPPIPFKVTCRGMGLDPCRLREEHAYRVIRWHEVGDDAFRDSHT